MCEMDYVVSGTKRVANGTVCAVSSGTDRVFDASEQMRFAPAGIGNVDFALELY